MPENIAVIGSGMAGLAAARFLHQAGHVVSIFEAQARRGMDAHTLDMAPLGGQGWVDIPLRVMSPMAWRHVLALAADVGVTTFPVTTYVSCSQLDQKTWFRSTRLPVFDIPFVGSWRYLRPQSLRILFGLQQLFRAQRRLAASPNAKISLAEFYRQNPIDPLCWRGLVLPLLTTICTCREEHLLAWPAQSLLQLLETLVSGTQLVRLRGGTRHLVERLTEGLTLYGHRPVIDVTPEGQTLVLRTENGDHFRFDRVIVATQANQTSFLPETHFARERKLLAGITFDKGELLVHTDTRFMPAASADWVSLNYMTDTTLQNSMFTVWVNAVEPSLASVPAIFQTWNPLFPPRPETILRRVPIERAVVHEKNETIWKELEQLHAEGDRRLFFAGAWAYPGVPLLESAVCSALAIASRLGTTPRWAKQVKV